MTTFTDQEKATIVAALYTVAPTGGGSHELALVHRLEAEWGMPVDAMRVEGYAFMIIREYEENVA